MTVVLTDVHLPGDVLEGFVPGPSNPPHLSGLGTGTRRPLDEVSRDWVIFQTSDGTAGGSHGAVRLSHPAY